MKAKYTPAAHPYIAGSWALRNDDGAWLEYDEEDGTSQPFRFDSEAEAVEYADSLGKFFIATDAQ